MWVNMNVQIGLNGLENAIGATWVSPSVLGNISGWAGSFHILSMGRHFIDYVISPRNFVFQNRYLNNSILPNSIYLLNHKQRASNVTGNIGECVAALFAREFMELGISDIAHIGVRQGFRKRKCPDYLLKINQQALTIFNVNSHLRVPWPQLWPAESKARAEKTSANSSKKKSFEQLISYWFEIAHQSPSSNDLGYGFIFTFCTETPSITATIIFPNTTQYINLSTHLQNNHRSQIDTDSIRGCLYEC